MANSEIKDRLRKVYELTLRGEPGEKEAAQKALDRMMEKYDVSIEELDENVVQPFVLEFHGKEQEQLLVQIVYKVLNEGTCLHSMVHTKSGRPCRTKAIVDCTPAQKAEIEFLMEFYTELYEREKKLFMIAFVQKHQLFGNSPSGGGESDLSFDEITRVFAMKNGMADAVPYLQIEGK